MPWSSRTEIQGWPEKLTDDAPASRHETICALLDAKRLDLPTFVRIPVRGGLEVEAMTDVVQFGGVRLCMGQQTAQAICDAWGCMMMTSGIADAVWKHAHVRMPVLNIDPNPGGAKQWLLYEADRLGAAFNQRAAKLLEAGTPFLPGFSIVDPLGKDYVLDPRLKAEPGQCAIYGWHNGKDGSDLAVIQSGGTGASLKHHLGFFDYSQMVRLVRRQAWLGGVAVDLADIYEKRPELVNHRGVMGTPPIPARHPAVPFRASGGGVA